MQLHNGIDGVDLVMHQDIREGRKQAGGVGGHLKLGTPLTIQMPGSDALTFEDLDDVIANFAEPYLENVRALVGTLQLLPLLALHAVPVPTCSSLHLLFLASLSSHRQATLSAAAASFSVIRHHSHHAVRLSAMC